MSRVTRFEPGSAVAWRTRESGAEGHDRELADGLRTTLGRIKAGVETAGRD